MGLAVKNNNPGNLRDPATGNFRTFASPQEGYAALLNDLQAKQTGTTTTGLGPSSTLVDFASRYAPAGDNNDPAQYAASLANKIGTRPDAQLKDLDLQKWASAVASNEDNQSIFGAQAAQGYNPKPYSTGAVPGLINYGAPNEAGAPQDTSTLGGQLSQRGKDASGALELAGTGATEIVGGKPLTGVGHLGSGLLQTAGAAAGGIGDVIGAALGLIPGVKQAEEVVGQGIGALASTDVGQKVVKGGQDFAEKHPVLAKDLGAAGNIVGLVGGGLGAKVGKEAVEKGLYDAAKEGLIGAGAKNVVEKNAVKDAGKILGSKPTTNAIKSGVRTGNTTVAGGVPGVLPDKLQQASIDEVANLVKSGAVSTKKLAVENAAAIKQAADTEAETMRSLIHNSEVQKIVQPEELKSLAERVIKRAGESATAGENPAATLLRVFEQNLPKGADITAEDILNARQAVSNFVLENKGDWNMRGVLTGFKSARNAFWDESRTFLKELAPDVPIEEMLAKQSNLYRALDYIVPNVKKELGTTAWTRFLKDNPAKVGLIKEAMKYLGIGYGLHLFNE